MLDHKLLSSSFFSGGIPIILNLAEAKPRGPTTFNCSRCSARQRNRFRRRHVAEEEGQGGGDRRGGGSGGRGKGRNLPLVLALWEVEAVVEDGTPRLA